MSESEKIKPYTVEDPDGIANVCDEFVGDVEVECGPEKGIEEGRGLMVFHE